MNGILGCMNCAKKIFLFPFGFKIQKVLSLRPQTGIARSSKGRTAGFGPVSGGSNPPWATITLLSYGLSA
jgi:hypothetical protein